MFSKAYVTEQMVARGPVVGVVVLKFIEAEVTGFTVVAYDCWWHVSNSS